MKKTFLIASIILLMMFTCIVLTGCDKNKEGEDVDTVGENEQILTVDLGDGDAIQAKFAIPKNTDIEVTVDPSDESHVVVNNEKENYTMDIYLGDEMEETFLAGQDDDKEEEGYKETKYGNFNGYHYNFGESTIYGNIVLDTETYNVYTYIFYTLEVDMDAKKSVSDIYESKDIQKILNSFSCKYITIEEETEEVAE